MNKTKEKVLSFIYGNNYDKIYDLINGFKQIDNYSGFEFEIRIANVSGHCNHEYWNAYDTYLEPYSSHNDIIVSYQNQDIQLKDRFIREYVYGTLAQEKVLISRLESVSTNINVIPLVTKLSHERYIPLKHVKCMKKYISTYARTYRKSFNISCPLLTERNQRYIENWSVDKTVRIISKSISDYRIRETLVDDVDNPTEFDILDLEFEYVGEHDELEDSIIALIEFLYFAHPTYCKRFYNVSLDFQYYSMLASDKITELFIQPKIKQLPNCRNKFIIPDESIPKLLIYDNDTNYIETDIESIDLTHFIDNDLNRFSIIYVFKSPDQLYYPIDIFSYNNKFVYSNKCNERAKLLKSIVSSSKLLKRNDEHIKSHMLIAVYDNYKDICVLPNKFYIHLNVKMCSDEQSYVLYTAGGSLLISPLLRNKLYIPIGRNDFETRILMRKTYINNVNIKFECKLINGYIELLPIDITNKINTLQESVFIILEAYSQAFNVSMLEMPKVNILDEMLFQVLLEKENVNEYKNVFIYAPFEQCVSKAIKFANYFITYDSLIFQSTEKNVVNNLNEYHESSLIIPILKDTRIIRSESKSIYALNNKQNIYHIPEIYTNNMNLIITSFHKYDMISEFVKTFEVIRTNICEGGKVVFNYIDDDIDMLKFVYNIDEVVEIKLTDRNMYEKVSGKNDKNIMILCEDITEFRVNKMLENRPIDKLTILKTSSKRAFKKLTKLATDGEFTIYKHGENTNACEMEKQLSALTLNVLYRYYNNSNDNDDVSSILGGGIIGYLLDELSKKYGFNMTISYPINTKELMDKISYDISIISTEFKDVYKKYTSVVIKF